MYSLKFKNMNHRRVYSKAARRIEYEENNLVPLTSHVNGSSFRLKCSAS